VPARSLFRSVTDSNSAPVIGVSRLDGDTFRTRFSMGFAAAEKFFWQRGKSGQVRLSNLSPVTGFLGQWYIDKTDNRCKETDSAVRNGIMQSIAAHRHTPEMANCLPQNSSGSAADSQKYFPSPYKTFPYDSTYFHPVIPLFCGHRSGQN
jgi:hypothetical protein